MLSHRKRRRRRRLRKGERRDAKEDLLITRGLGKRRQLWRRGGVSRRRRRVDRRRGRRKLGKRLKKGRKRQKIESVKRKNQDPSAKEIARIGKEPAEGNKVEKSRKNTKCLDETCTRFLHDRRSMQSHYDRNHTST